MAKPLVYLRVLVVDVTPPSSPPDASLCDGRATHAAVPGYPDGGLWRGPYGARLLHQSGLACGILRRVHCPACRARTSSTPSLWETARDHLGRPAPFRSGTAGSRSARPVEKPPSWETSVLQV